MAENNTQVTSNESPEVFTIILRLDEKFLEGQSPFLKLVKEDLLLSPPAVMMIKSSAQSFPVKIRLNLGIHGVHGVEEEKDVEEEKGNLEIEDSFAFLVKESVPEASLICSKFNMSVSQNCEIHMVKHESNLIIRIFPPNKESERILKMNFELFEASI